MIYKIDQQSSLEFEVIETLDKGKMSEILLAECTDNRDLRVAIKRPRQDKKNVDQWMDQVEKEISVLHHLNTAESPDWSFEMSLRNRLSYTYSTVAERSIIQLISVFDIDGLTAVALEVAPPSLTRQTLDKYTLIKVMHQLAHTMHLVHSNGLALTDFNPLMKSPRVRWDVDAEQVKVIDWNVTGETEELRRRDIIYLGRLYFELLTGYPAWAKGEPLVDGLPSRYNEYVLENASAGIDSWVNLESALRYFIERLIFQDATDAILTSDALISAMDRIKLLADLNHRIANGSDIAINEMEEMLQEAANSRPPQIRDIVDVGSFFLPVAPESYRARHESQVMSSERLLRTAYLDRIVSGIEYFNRQSYGDAVAEFENARSRLSSNNLISNATDYRYAVAHVGEEIQGNGTLDDEQLKALMDKLIELVQGLELRMWDIEHAEGIRDEIRTAFPAKIVNMPDVQAVFQDIDASKLYSEQIRLVNAERRQTHIDKGWEIRETQRLNNFVQQIIPKLEKANRDSFIKDRVLPRLEQLRATVIADQRDLNMVKRFLKELSEGSTSIDIEEYLAQATLERPYAPLTISSELLPRDQSDLSSDEVSGMAIERYQSFRREWDEIMQSSILIDEKLSSLRTLVADNEDIIEIFREKLPTVTVPGSTNERKTVYRDLEDLTQFVKSVDFVYKELDAIGLNRIPNISKIQKRWVYVTNVQDPELKRFVSSIQANLAGHTNRKVQDKSLAPELSMLVYEMLDVPVPTEVMQIGQEIQLHKYVRETLRQSKDRLKDADAIESVIGELNRLTARNLGELDSVIQQLLQKLEMLQEALQSRTIARQIRTLYRVLKRKVESENKDIRTFGEQIDEAVDDLINDKVKLIEVALDKAKTNKPMDREEEILVHDTQRVLDTLRHNNLLQERRWHHVQNSQAYLVREYTRTLEQATTTFNTYQYSESRKHIDRAFYLAQLFDMPSDKRLSDELRTAEEMVQQLQDHFTLTRAVNVVLVEDIQKLIQEEIEFWTTLHEIVREMGEHPNTEEDVDLTFDANSVSRVIEGLQKAEAVTDSMSRVHRAVDRLRDLQRTIDIYELKLLEPLSERLDDLLQYNYTQELSQQITEIEQIASRERIISNESIISRLQHGYALIEINKQLQILDDAESNRRQQQLQSNAYTSLKNIRLKNQDERQALADFIETLSPQEVQSRDFQGVLARLAEDQNSYAYLMEQVHNTQLPNFSSSSGRPIRIVIGVIIVVAIIAVIAGLILSGTLPIDGFTLSS